MKNLQFSLLPIAIIIFTICLQSCKKEASSGNLQLNPTDTTGNGNNNVVIDSSLMLFSAFVDGIAFTADTTGINYTFDNAFNLHVFTGPDAGNRIITLMLADLAVGTHTIDFDNCILTYQTGATVYTGGNNPQGQIIISKNENNKISGTFHGTVMDFGMSNPVITQGHFNNLAYVN